MLPPLVKTIFLLSPDRSQHIYHPKQIKTIFMSKESAEMKKFGISMATVRMVRNKVYIIIPNF